MRSISIFILTIIYLLSAAGIIVFQSHCDCSGTGKVSVYVSPATCMDEYHVHHTHNEDGEEVSFSPKECHECTAHTDECGCNAPNIKVFKLDNKVLNEKTGNEKVEPVRLRYLKYITEIPYIFSINTSDAETDYIDPPPLIKTSFDFLIIIQQLKIPDTA